MKRYSPFSLESPPWLIWYFSASFLMFLDLACFLFWSRAIVFVLPLEPFRTTRRFPSFRPSGCSAVLSPFFFLAFSCVQRSFLYNLIAGFASFEIPYLLFPGETWQSGCFLLSPSCFFPQNRPRVLLSVAVSLSSIPSPPPQSILP